MTSTFTTNNNIAKEINKQICEALECFDQATIEIRIDAGKFGKIPLFLCKQCVSKFTIQGGNRYLGFKNI
ncbi:MAG: hypothetical protein K0S93_323 [Nitrososphaeraceae archaeon]|jgi:hypothetical protein|nr:hypothetical protein [Nitrososphaeraceae archaeon]